MIKLPVLLGFDDSQVIGEITLDETKLPKEPNYHFGLGYRILHMVKDDNFPGGYREVDTELMCVSLVHDSKFKAWHDATKA